MCISAQLLLGDMISTQLSGARGNGLAQPISFNTDGVAGQQPAVAMHPDDIDFLRPLAAKYIGWKTPEQALTHPLRVVAQVMNIGEHEDLQAMSAALGDDTFRSALHHAEAGQFNARSWAYWHCRLGLAGVDAVPPLPQRQFV